MSLSCIQHSVLNKRGTMSIPTMKQFQQLANTLSIGPHAPIKLGQTVAPASFFKVFQIPEAQYAVGFLLES